MSTSASSCATAGAVARRNARLKTNRIGNDDELGTDRIRKTLDRLFRTDSDKGCDGGGQEKTVVLDGVSERDATTRRFPDPTSDVEHIVVMGRCTITDRNVHDRKAMPFAFQVSIVDAEGAHVIGPCLLAPDEIVRMMCDTHLVGFGVPDANTDIGNGILHSVMHPRWLAGARYPSCSISQEPSILRPWHAKRP